MTLGNLVLVPIVLTAFYVSLIIYSSLIKYKHGLKGESFFLVGLAVSTFAAVIMNFVLGYKFLISGMAVLSLIFYYMYFATQTLTRDALTDAFNRHSFYSDIPSMKKKDMFIISMDLNGLKKINDTLGHDEGDKAILAVTHAAFTVIPDKCRFYRMGGDEFQILYPGADEGRVKKLCEDLKKETEAKGYSVACGYMEYKKDGNFDEALRSAFEFRGIDNVSCHCIKLFSSKSRSCCIYSGKLCLKNSFVSLFLAFRRCACVERSCHVAVVSVNDCAEVHKYKALFQSVISRNAVRK